MIAQYVFSSLSDSLPDLSKKRTDKKLAIKAQLVVWPLFEIFIIFIEKTVSLLATS